MNKAALRTDYRAQRDAMDELTRQRAASLIRQRLFEHTWWRESEYVLFYISFGSEVDTHLLIQEAIRFKKKVYVPIFDPAAPDHTPISPLKRWGDLAPALRAGMME